MKKSFFEKLTGSSRVEDNTFGDEQKVGLTEKDNGWMEEDNEEGQLTVDVYQTPNDIIIKAIVAGVRPEDLDVSITQEMVTIKGKREESHRVEKEDYFYQELYWGSFSRSILLPQEINPDEAEATV
ncbi:MAG: Hsp20/alpha crystallin family protein [bacterium]|nr:Hsp20/alpha crystallin family protein [bacterium]